MVRRTKRARAREPNIKYFTKSTTLPGWTCNLCAAGSTRAPVMTAQQTVQHEKSPEHLRVIAVRDQADQPKEPDPSALTMEGLQLLPELDKQDWVDIGPEVIGFWREGVEAAERGEEPEKLQVWLERIVNSKIALKKNNEWTADPNTLGQGWGVDAGNWGAPSPRQPEDHNDRDSNSWLYPRIDSWGEQRAVNDPWAASAPKMSWDDWPKSGAWEGDVNPSSPSKRVWRHPQGSLDSSCSNGQASGSGGSRLAEFAQQFTSRHRVAAARKDRLDQFVKMPPEQQLAKIHENILQLRHT